MLTHTHLMERKRQRDRSLAKSNTCGVVNGLETQGRDAVGV